MSDSLALYTLTTDLTSVALSNDYNELTNLQITVCSFRYPWVVCFKRYTIKLRHNDSTIMNQNADIACRWFCNGIADVATDGVLVHQIIQQPEVI